MDREIGRVKNNRVQMAIAAPMGIEITVALPPTGAISNHLGQSTGN
ncbi:MAG: hypothetical protein NW220_08510 [Leptolyngbyaceae cyanobacterium bins.349]|nr:hypothetical protein [Leptolyngbyaceae cyanobacterium bins.349]